MYKIYKDMTLKDDRGERKIGFIFYDPEKPYYLFRSYGDWKLGSAKFEVVNEGKVISNPLLKNQLLKHIKHAVAISEKMTELEQLRREFYKITDCSEKLYGEAFPTAQYIKNTLECDFPHNIRFTSYTTSPEYEQSFTISRVNDLGTRRTDLLASGHGDYEDHLKVSEKTLFANHGPKLVKFQKTQFKTIVVEKTEHSWQGGDKESLTVFASYYVKIKKLSSKNLATVMEEIKTLASMI